MSLPDDPASILTRTLNLVWDANLLEYVRMEQPIIEGGTIVVGAVDQGSAGVDPWLMALTAGQLSTLTPPAAITGYATSAKQDTLLAELQLKADLTETQPVSLASAPLPTGAATAARQDTGNTTLAAIDTRLAFQATAANQTFGNSVLEAIELKTPALGQALAAASSPVVLTAAQITTLTPPAAITGFLTEADFDTKVGSLTEVAPATDTASSGLNGRLQRIAQRLTSLITALGSPFQAGGSIGNTTFGATQATAANLNATVVGAAGAALALDASLGTLNTAVNTLLKPANTLAAVTSVGTLAGQATSYGKTLTYVPVAQGAAGTTVLAAANASARHKIIGCLLTMSAAGTLKFLDGSGDLTGAMDVGASGGFVLPAALLPYQQTNTNSALSITSTVGAAKGVVTILTEA